ncbi:tumor necrosis factor receptor superfamily member 6B-like isoform X2 [Hoplias malabaricus]|uniref:tumor necrosis factor receptor superfamily member 6B-like isoform X2 n=1 Tax=Hoplias malabaricus TaxID=27720 RepID=UPI0034624296
MAKTAILILLLPLFHGTSTNEYTYEHELASGVKLTCDRCEPGFYLRSHCTATRPTRCNPCIQGFYTKYWNYIPECLPCDLCGLNLVETQPCTPKQNRQCQCQDGYYWYSHYCKKHSVCPNGHVIKSKGTPYKDTECEPCSDGYYVTGEAGSAQCTAHTTCRSDEKLMVRGTSCHDNMCLSCNNITSQGWTSFIKPVLTEMFAQQKKPLHRLCRKLNISGNQTAIDKDNSALKIKTWLSDASEQQLTQLPATLKLANMHNLAEKVEKKLKKFQEEAKQCDNNII